MLRLARLPVPYPLLAGRRVTSRPEFAPYPAGIAQLVDQLEQIGIVDFDQVRFMPVRHAADLDMTNTVYVPMQFSGQVALDDLAVVAVELNLQAAGAHFLADAWV